MANMKEEKRKNNHRPHNVNPVEPPVIAPAEESSRRGAENEKNAGTDDRNDDLELSDGGPEKSHLHESRTVERYVCCEEGDDDFSSNLVQRQV